MTEPDAFDPGWEARKLLRAARAGTLASAVPGGQPFASLVTPACAPDLSLLMLLSGLSEHTRHLRADPRCAVLVAGAAEGVNPQTAPRVTVTGVAEPIEAPGLKARWLAVHPYAALYADFGDFSLWRVRIGGGLLVGGFARAHRLRTDALLPDPAAVGALLEAEHSILAHCNDHHSDALAAIARSAGMGPGDWRMITADVDGCDLAAGEVVARIPWSSPAQHAEDVRRELVVLARKARGADQDTQ